MKKIYPKLWPYLLAVAVLLLYLIGRPPEHNIKPLLFPQLERNRIVKVKISKFSHTESPELITLQKEPGWKVVSSFKPYPADLRAVNMLLKRIVFLREGDFVTDNPVKYPVFQVEGSYLLIEVFSQGMEKPAAFYIGKNGPNLTGTYFRKADSKRVFLLRRNIHLSFDRYEWRRKELFDFPESRITGLSVAYHNFSCTVSGEKERLAAGKLIREIRRLRAADFASARDKPTFDPAGLLTVKISMAGAKEIKLLIGGQRNPTLTYAKIEGRGEVYLLLSQTVARIKQLAKDLN
ncbi:MAG: DUF4340 domain-containing protein [bacterium]